MALLSIRLDDDTRITLEAEAAARRVGLSTLVRDLATEAARQLRRDRIRGQSAAVGAYVAQSEAGAAFYAGWGRAERGD